jgi:hypothetical protein
VGLFEPLFQALNASSGRYVVVGGLATVLHGHARLTADVDLIVDFDAQGLAAMLDALVALGLRPRPPVEAREFADPTRRAEWVREKGMRVFSLWDPKNPMLEVDLFVDHPMDFEDLWQRSEEVDLGGTVVRIASIPDLIQLKRLAGRPQDIQDIEALEEIEKRRDDES